MNEKTEQKNSRVSPPLPPQPLTCSSVLGLAFDSGVVLAADSLVSYEGLAMFNSAQRILKVNDSIILGGGKRYADFQYLQGVVEDKTRSVPRMSPLELKDFLRSGLYNRSIMANPLQVDLVLAGIQDGVPFLCQLDQRGFVSQDQAVATGFAAKMILPFLKYQLDKRGHRVSEEEARLLVRQSMETLHRRHSLAHHTYHVGVVDAAGARVERISLREP